MQTLEQVSKEPSSKIESAQTRFEVITRKWWFFVLLIALQFASPYTSVSVDPSEYGWVTGAVLSEALIYDMSFLYPIFKIAPILLVASLYVFKNRASRILSVYAGITYVLFAFLQSMAFTEDYGFAIIFSNLFMFLLVAAAWFWEAAAQKNDLSSFDIGLSRVWVVPLAVAAFWYPLEPVTLVPDFNPLYLITNMAGLAFCLMTPLYLSVLILAFPNVNLATMRVTSVVGIIIAFYNILVNFVMFPELLFWNGLLHIPLLVISVYSAALSFRHRAP
ncbi:MAG: hypothetical protein JSW61_10910 [Candidatus Thorarchaeota archaeon]|nr:MAG: hypothetical protein JSW61_10910 [Candidatus Thorarchaeota archaeon]